MTIMNLNKTTVIEIVGNDVVTADTTSSAVDLVDYEGDMEFILCAEAGGSGVTYAVKVTEADTSGGSYTDVTDGAFTTTTANTKLTEKISLNTNEMKRYIKVVIDITGSGGGAVCVLALGSKKYG
jgi:hypothetical protein